MPLDPAMSAAVRAASRTPFGWRHSERMIQAALTAAIPHLTPADLTSDLVANIEAGALRDAADRLEGPLNESELRTPQWRAGRLTAVGMLRRLADEADEAARRARRIREVLDEPAIG